MSVAHRPLPARRRTRKARISQLEAPFGDHVVVSVPLSRPASFATLTKAEVEVAEGLLAGSTLQELARARKVSARTVGHQVAAIYKKVGVSSRYELVALVARSKRPKVD